MRASLDATLRHLSAHEDGYVNHPADPGGCTNMGITIGTYRRRVNPGGTCADLRKMPWSTAHDIYAGTYWRASGGDALPPGLDLVVCDMGVNAGPRRAVRMLQRLLGVGQDGIVGEITAGAAWEGGKTNVKGLIGRYADARLAYYRSLRIWATFGNGWTNRTREATSAALTLVEASGAWDAAEPGEALPGTIDTPAPTAGAASGAEVTVEASATALGAGLANVLRTLGTKDWRHGDPAERAARLLQTELGTPADGIFGPATWEALARYLAGSAQVAAAQEELGIAYDLQALGIDD
jgi:lysozyme family protein